ncbi:hypothetical protein DDZ15_10880 [Rhodohalobacter mucosus]|uniref:Uncharacterized protein n=1 Tax=Rhodohalobacter mucosus TaxID=2079485 RepID=A0A316TNY0_9BACT|nr:hypothetical protein DDZ15_10880 [Rhodohalobacter mucosus]
MQTARMNAKHETMSVFKPDYNNLFLGPAFITIPQETLFFNALHSNSNPGDRQKSAYLGLFNG